MLPETAAGAIVNLLVVPATGAPPPEELRVVTVSGMFCVSRASAAHRWAGIVQLVWLV